MFVNYECSPSENFKPILFCRIKIERTSDQIILKTAKNAEEDGKKHQKKREETCSMEKKKKKREKEEKLTKLALAVAGIEETI